MKELLGLVADRYTSYAPTESFYSEYGHRQIFILFCLVNWYNALLILQQRRLKIALHSNFSVCFIIPVLLDP